MSLFCLFVSLLSIQIYASEEVFELEKVEVSAKKKVSEFDFSKTHTVTSSQLESEASGLVSSQLSYLPGVVANQNGGPGGRISFFIRGTDSRHVAFTIDGLKMNDPSNTDRQFDSAFFSSPILKQVEVHKGPQAVLYGSDAMGGLVEMTTRKGEELGETRLTLSAGSFGTVATSLANDWGNQNHRGTITAYKFHTDGISRLNRKRFNATERDSTDTTQLSSSSRHQWNHNFTTDFLFSFLRGYNELDGNTKDNSTDESRNDHYLAQQKTNLRLNKTSAISLRNGLSRHDRVIDAEFMGTQIESIFEGNLVQNELLYKFDHKSFSFLSGLATEHEEIKSSGIDKSFDLHSLFGQGAWKFGVFKLFGGTRVEKHVRYGSFYTGSGGASLQLDHSNFFLQYSQGFKAPSLFQLYGPSFSGFQVGNPDLVPEVNHSWEGGWQFRENGYETGITLFQNRLSNLITYTETLGYINQSRFIAEGIELSAGIKRESYYFTSSFTHQQFRKEESTIVGRPLNSLLTGIAIFPTDQSEVSLKGRWFSSRMSEREVKLNGFESFDLGMRYLFSRMDLGLQVLNLLNRDYEEVYGYSMMPRSIFLSAGFRF